MSTAAGRSAFRLLGPGPGLGPDRRDRAPPVGPCGPYYRRGVKGREESQAGRRGRRCPTPAVIFQMRAGARRLLADEDDHAQLRQQPRQSSRFFRAFAELGGRHLPGPVPPRDRVPGDGLLPGNFRLPHEREGVFRRGVVVVPADEARARPCAGGGRHRTRLLEEEQDGGVDAAIERVEVRDLDARPLPQPGDVFVQRLHVPGVQQFPTP